jgi:hypothetical protein
MTRRRTGARTDGERASAERWLLVLRRGGDVRRKVRTLRQKVRDESYENGLKLSIAIDRLLRELRE